MRQKKVKKKPLKKKKTKVTFKTNLVFFTIEWEIEWGEQPHSFTKLYHIVIENESEFQNN